MTVNMPSSFYGDVPDSLPISSLLVNYVPLHTNLQADSLYGTFLETETPDSIGQQNGPSISRY